MSENIYGGPFPWTSLFGVSGIGGGMSEEDIAWQAYLDYSGLPQAGASGADYLGNFLPDIDLSDLPPEVAEAISGDAIFADETIADSDIDVADSDIDVGDIDVGGLSSLIADSDIDLSGLETNLAELIAGGTLTANASGVPGPVSIDDSIPPYTPPDFIPEKDKVIEEITTTGEPPFGYNILNAYDTLSGILGNIDLPSTTGMGPYSGSYASDSELADEVKDPRDSIGYNMLSDSLSDAGDYIGETYDDVSDYIGETIGGLTGDQIAGLAGEELGTGLPDGDPVDDEVDDLIYAIGDPKNYPANGEGAGEEGAGEEGGETVEEEGGGIKDWLSKAYDKLGIQGILGILSLLGLGKSIGASGEEDQLGSGGIGSFASSQFDPSGFGATADYANMPGGGVGQPTWLPNTNAPIYYPFASEVTKQYNAQQEGPFSFTTGPPPDAMIQNLTSQKIPGVTYVADGAFMRRNGFTEGPGTETSDDIPAMLSDGEFVTNAEANRGIGAMALLNQGMPMEEAMNPEQQRLAGARQMYLQQAMGQQLAKQMRNS